MNLSRGSPSPLTSSLAFLGTFMVKMFHLYGVMEDIEGPDTAGDDVRGLGDALGSFNFFFLNQTTGSMVKNIAYGG